MAARRFATRTAGYGLAGVIVLSSCGRAPRAVPDPAPAASSAVCWLAPPPSAAAESLVVVVDDRIGDGGSEGDPEGEDVMASLTVGRTVRDGCAGERSRARAAAVGKRGDPGVAEDQLSLDTRESTGAPSGIVRLRPAPTDRRFVRGVRLGARDPRDALDEGAAALVTADLHALRYARERGDLIVIALAPRWIYGVSVAGSDSANRSPLPALDDLRRSLARDVVPADAREPLELDGALTPCAVRHATPAQSSSHVAPAIAYRAHDPVARAIAERLVSLSARGDNAARALLPPGASGLAAVPRGAEELVRALDQWDDAAYVIAWRVGTGRSCGANGSFDEANVSTGAPAGARRTPLIVVAEWLIVRRGTVGVLIDSAGALRLVRGPGGEGGTP